MPNDSALLVGATGLVGAHVLQLLLEESAYRTVVVLVRRELPLKHAKLIQHVVDFEHLGEAAKSIHVSDVFCCLGTTIRKARSQSAFRKVDFTYPHELARITHVNGARQFLIITAVGADPASRVFYSRVKGEIEDAIRKIPFIGVHIFRPSVLVGKREEFRLGERLAMGLKFFSFAMVGGWRKYRPIAAETVARAMIRAAREGRPGINVYEFDQIQALSGPG